MRAIIKNSLLILAATAVLGSDAASGQATQRRAVNDSAPASIASAKLPLGIGDKLKISFYETIDIAAMKQGGRDRADPQGALRTFYQRMDLSEDYTVEQDGAISVPLLGRFQVEGRPLDDVRADLAASFTSVIGRTANINVKIVDRPPVYVVGPVRNPGAYKYVPGMIVLHALALAGGLGGGEGLSGMIEGARETERLRTMTLQTEQLLARRARLEAERDGAVTLPIPIQLAKLAGEKTAQTLLATENAISRAEQARRQQQGREIASKLAAARSELEALKGKLEQSEIQKEMRVERLKDMQKLKERGLVTTNRVIAVRTELSDIEAHRQDYLVAIVQAEARLAEAQEASPRLLSENTANLANAIATVDKEIATAQQAMISARRLANILYPRSGTSQTETYEIVRQSKDGANTLQATETSPLMPGDVLKINTNTGIVNPTSVAPPVPQSVPTPPYINTANKN